MKDVYETKKEVEQEVEAIVASIADRVLKYDEYPMDLVDQEVEGHELVIFYHKAAAVAAAYGDDLDSDYWQMIMEGNPDSLSKIHTGVAYWTLYSLVSEEIGFQDRVELLDLLFEECWKEDWTILDWLCVSNDLDAILATLANGDVVDFLAKTMVGSMRHHGRPVVDASALATAIREEHYLDLDDLEEQVREIFA